MRVLKYIDVDTSNGDTEWELDRMTIRTDAGPDAVWRRITGRYSEDARIGGFDVRERSAAETADVPGASGMPEFREPEPVADTPEDMTLGELLNGLLEEAGKHCRIAESMSLDYAKASGDFRFTFQFSDGTHAHAIISKGGGAEIMNQIGSALYEVRP